MGNIQEVECANGKCNLRPNPIVNNCRDGKCYPSKFYN